MARIEALDLSEFRAEFAAENAAHAQERTVLAGVRERIGKTWAGLTGRRSLTPDGRYIAPGRTYEADERAAMHS